MTEIIIESTVSVTPDAGIDAGWVIDLAQMRRWKIREKRDFMAVLLEFQTNSLQADESKMFPALAKIVQRWSFEGLDPSKPEDYLELDYDQFAEVINQILKSFRGNRPGTEDANEAGGQGNPDGG